MADHSAAAAAPDYAIGAMAYAMDRALHDPSGLWHGPLSWAEDRTKVPRIRLLLALVTVLSYWLLFAHGLSTLVNVVAYAYPARRTLALIRRPPASLVARASARVRWLTYWMTFAAVQIVHRHSAPVVARVPFHVAAKCAFLVWCAAPIRHNGADAVHARIGRYLENWTGARFTYD